jgi:preprotein translocase SecE subunit
VMTAVLLGALFLAGAAWVAKEIAAINLPRPTWELTLQDAKGQPAPGSSLNLLTTKGLSAGQTPLKIGTADVETYTDQSEGHALLVIKSIKMDEGREPSSATLAQLPGQASLPGQAETPPAFGATVLSAVGRPIVEPLVLQSVAGSVIILVGVLVAYWIVGRKRSTVDFLVATDGEMRKVNWSTRREIMGSTWVVIGATFLIAGFLAVVDGVFSEFFKLLNVLQR